MSADLLADLDSYYNPWTSPTTPSKQENINNVQFPVQPTHTSNIGHAGAPLPNQNALSHIVSQADAQSSTQLRKPPNLKASTKVDEDEDFGDFEVAPPTATSNTINSTQSWNDSLETPSSQQANLDWDWTAEGVSPWETTRTQFQADGALSSARQAAHAEPDRHPRNLDVIFDADEEINEAGEGDDEFGSFVDGPPHNQQESDATTSKLHGLSLIDFGDETTPLEGVNHNSASLTNTPRPLATTPSTALKEPQLLDFEAANTGVRPAAAEKNLPRNSVGKSSSATGSQSQNSQSVRLGKRPISNLKNSTIKEPDDDMSAWDDFEAVTPVASTLTPSQEELGPPPGGVYISGATDESNVKTVSEDHFIHKLPQLLSAEDTPQSAEPPRNIPPPALLISIFSKIFALAKSELFEPLATYSNDPSMRDSVLKHPVTGFFLVSYLSIAAVLARTIAGRKLRWKRDTILAQSMRIGPASSARTSGMKLTSIDRGENAKEEREVTEAIRSWQLQLGRVRSAVTSIKAFGLSLAVPEITETIAVKTILEKEGGTLAPKACALCGLKRNERVAKVDPTDLLDNFGEFWVEHWGHTQCYQFWEYHSSKLKGR